MRLEKLHYKRVRVGNVRDDVKLVLDYPVGEYIKSDGTKVKAHEREGSKVKKNRNLSSMQGIKNILSNEIKNDKTFEDIKKSFQKFKEQCSGKDIQNIISAGACHAINPASVHELKKKGWNIKSLTIEPKDNDEGLPEHTISIIKDKNGKIHIIDFLVEQFEDIYDIQFKANINQVIYTLEEYKDILKHYKQNILRIK